MFKWKHHRHPARVREQLHHGYVLGLTAAHINGSDAVAFRVHLVDDVSRLKGDGFKGDVVLAREVLEAIVLAKENEGLPVTGR